MPRSVLPLAPLLFAALALVPPPAARPADRPPGGKLVVLVVFDQMRGDYLSRWASAFGPDGFERLKKDGVWFSDCHLPYACTSTGPGHASVVTGAPPSVHGIVENDWYDRKEAARVYSVQPLRPYDRVPPLAEAAGKAPARGVVNGFSPERLLAGAETVGDKLRAATGGKGKVVALSIKDRSLALMAGKRPTAAYCFDARDGRFVTTTYYRDRPHPWVATFNEAKPADVWFQREWTPFKADAALYDRLAGPDDAPGEGKGYAQGKTFPHPMSKSDDTDKAYYGAVETSPFGNDLLFDLVQRAVVAERLGEDDAADLLCVSFSSNDLVGHQWGPDSWEALDVTLRSDRLMAGFLWFLDETVGKGRYTVVMTADHGVCPIPEQKRYPKEYPAADRVPDRALFLGLLDALDREYGGPTAWIEPIPADAGKVLPWVYLNRKAIEAKQLDPAVVAAFAARWCGSRPYTMAAFTPKQIAAGELPPHAAADRDRVREIAAMAKLAYHPDRCGDVLVVPKPGVQLTSYADGTGHGSPHAYDTHVPLVVYGAGVPAAGKVERKVSSLAAAPVLALALGVDPPAGATEKVPAEITGAK